MVLFSELKKSEKLRRKGRFSFFPQSAAERKIFPFFRKVRKSKKHIPQFPQIAAERKFFLFSAKCGGKEKSPIFRKLRKPPPLKGRDITSLPFKGKGVSQKIEV